MSTTSEPAADYDQLLTRQDAGARVDKGFRLLALTAGATVLAILALIAVTTTQEAWPVFREAGFDFLTSDRWVPNLDPPVFGALAFIYGTVVVSVIALVVAVPLSFCMALFITELAPKRIRNAVTSLIDLLAAVPSVVIGLWGLAVLAPNIVGLYERIHDVLGPVPVLGTLFGEGATGRGLMTAGLVLAIMIVPIVTSIMREVLFTVPETDRNGALALGATRWEMIRGVIVPHSLGGMVGAVMLGLGRAMGETIAVALTIGGSAQITANLFQSGDAMPAVIVNEFGEASGMHRSALIALGVLLFALTIIVNVAARWMVAKAETRLRGAT